MYTKPSNNACDAWYASSPEYCPIAHTIATKIGRIEIMRSTVRQSFTLEAKPARAAEISTIAKPNSNVAYGASQPGWCVRSNWKLKIVASTRMPHATAHSPKYTTLDWR